MENLEQSPKVSIVICTLNNYTYLTSCIEAIRETTADIPIEIIVTCNSATEPTISVVKSLKVKALLVDKNIGFGAACNLGAKEATGEYVCFLNDDTLPAEQWLHNLIAAFENGQKELKLDSPIGAVGPVSNYVAGRQRAPNSDISPAYRNQYAKSLQHVLTDAGMLVGFCLLTKRELFLKVNGFDEAFYCGCFIPGTMVRTKNGALEIENIRVGDSVVGHDGTLDTVIKTFCRPFAGTMVKLSITGRPKITATPEHPFLVFDTIKHDFIWKKAENLVENDLVSFALPKTAALHKFAGIQMTPVLCRLLGLYLAEGGVYYGKDENRGYGPYSRLFFSLGSHETELINFVQNSLKEIFGCKRISTSYKKESKACQISTQEKNVVDFFIQFGRLSSQRDVLRELFGLPFDLLSEVVYGWLIGDGYLDLSASGGPRLTGTSANAAIAYFMLDALTILGGCPRIMYKTQKYPEERELEDTHTYDLVMTGCHIPKRIQELFKLNLPTSKELSRQVYSGRQLLSVRAASRINFTGEVFNIETEKTNSYHVNGVAVHNCEDNAFSIDLMNLGYHLLIVGDSFVYHYGSQTLQKFPLMQLGTRDLHKLSYKYHPKAPPKLSTLYRIKLRNEYFLSIFIRSIRKSLDFSDYILILDDNTDKKFIEVIKQTFKAELDEKILIRSYSRSFDEVRDRNELFDWARELQCDWAFVLDSDEIVEDKFNRQYAEKLMCPSNPHLRGYLMHEYTFWNDEQHYIIHAHWGWMCFPAGMGVMTNTGMRNIEQIQKGDFVLSHDGTFNKVLETSKRRLKGELFSIKATGSELIKATAEHPFLTKDGWKKAEELKVGDYLYVPGNKKNPKNVTCLSDLVPDLINDPWGKILLDKDFITFLGLYVAEGHLKYPSGVFLTFHEKETALHALALQSFKRFGIAPKAYQKSKNHGTQIVGFSAKLVKIFKELFETGSQNKRIPISILERFSCDQICWLLNGYFLGDGYFEKDRKNQTACSQSRTLMYHIKLLAQRLDSLVGVRKISDESGYRLNMRECVTRDRTRHFFDTSGGAFVRIDAVQMQKDADLDVYNLEVANTKTYTVHGIAVHNCPIRFVKLAPQRKIMIRSKSTLHCEPAPMLPLECLAVSSVRLKHYGYVRPEDRQEKYQWYEMIDTDKKFELIGRDDYSHLIDEKSLKMRLWFEDTSVTFTTMTNEGLSQTYEWLGNVLVFADEIVLVDTGISEEVKEFLKVYGIKVLSGNIKDGYSAVRNIGLSSSTCFWQFQLDLDEKIINYIALRRNMDSPNDGYLFAIANVLNNGQKTLSETVRLFRRDKKLRYQGNIHETIDKALTEKKCYVVRAATDLVHYGYLIDAQLLKQKMKRYLDMNIKELMTAPDAKTYYNLALHLDEIEPFDQFVELLFKKAVSADPKFLQPYKELVLVYIRRALRTGKVLLKAGQNSSHPAMNEAMERICKTLEPLVNEYKPTPPHVEEYMIENKLKLNPNFKDPAMKDLFIQVNGNNQGNTKSNNKN